MELQNKKFRAMVVGIPQRAWKWGRRAELRVRYADDPRPLKGHGYYRGLVACYEVDARYWGPRSRLGKLLSIYDLA